MTRGLLFYARRSIVLDDQDARMQLALAVDGLPGATPVKLVNDHQVLQVSLCLLTMEEDEAEDGGFPMVLKDEDDENLICNDARFHSTVKASFVIEGIDEARDDFGSTRNARRATIHWPGWHGRIPTPSKPSVWFAKCLHSLCSRDVWSNL